MTYRQDRVRGAGDASTALRSGGRLAEFAGPGRLYRTEELEGHRCMFRQRP